MEQSKVLSMDGIRLNVDELTVDTVTAKETFAEIFKVKDSFRRASYIADVRQRAKELKVPNKDFNDLLKAYRESHIQKAKRELKDDNFTDFADQPLELFCGDWVATDLGVKTTYINKEGIPEDVYACPHPMMLTERYINIDTGNEKAKIDFFKDGRWQSVVVDKKTIASRQSIVDLSSKGINVTSENSALLVKFLHELESLNTDKIKCYKSTERMGWIEHTKDFIPYVDNVKFDGEQTNKILFENIRECGSYDIWLKAAKEARQNEAVKILLAASFAAPIVSMLNKLPFFVHTWGGSGTGKTVALMLAASVWGNPAQGKLVRGMNSTAVGMERLAAFFNNLPCFFNELQTVKNTRGFDSLIYKLCEGTGRERGNKYGGNDKLSTWCNCFLSNGEQTILNDTSGAGAANRIIEIEIEEGCPLFTDAKATVDTVQDNYGHAGKVFIELISQVDIEDIKAEFSKAYDYLVSEQITEKQAMAGALLVTADHYANKLFWRGDALTPKAIRRHLKTQDEINPNVKAVEAIKQWLVTNKARFDDTENVDKWGRLESGKFSIMSVVLSNFLRDAGYDYKAVYRHLASERLIQLSHDGKSAIAQRINNIPVKCVVFLNDKIELLPLSEKDLDGMPF